MEVKRLLFNNKYLAKDYTDNPETFAKLENLISEFCKANYKNEAEAYYVSNQIKSISLTACELLRCGLGCRVSTIAIDFKKLMIWPRTQGFLFSKRGFSLYMSNLKKMRDQNKIF